MTTLRLVVVLCLVAGALSAQQRQTPADRYAEAHKKYMGATSPIPADDIRHFVYFARDRAAMRSSTLLDHPRFAGAQIMYPWSVLEPARDRYDFSAILDDYRFLASHGKALVVQLQDATFTPQFNAVPAYLMSREFDGGAIQQRADDGTIEGWVAKRWNRRVRERFAKLLAAMGAEFDGKIAAINLQETAVGVSTKDDRTFSGPGYVEAIQANMSALKAAFPSSVTIQYANFMYDEWLPGDDKGYLRSIYQHGERIGVGLGGPDLMFTRRGQLNHTIAMMHEGTFTVPLAIAVQDGNYIGETNTGRVVPNRISLVPALHAFAKDFMRVRYMFWSSQEPYFSEDVVPAFSGRR